MSEIYFVVALAAIVVVGLVLAKREAGKTAPMVAIRSAVKALVPPAPVVEMVSARNVGQTVSFAGKRGRPRTATLVGVRGRFGVLHVGHPNHADFRRPLAELRAA